MKDEITPGFILHSSSFRLILSLAAGCLPAVQGIGAFTAAAAGYQAFNTNMFIKVRPFDGITIPKQLPMPTFRFGSVQQSRIPRQGYTQTAAVGQING